LVGVQGDSAVSRRSGRYVFRERECRDRALVLNGDFLHPLHQRETGHVSRTVARWVGIAQRYSAKQARRGCRSGEARRAASAEQRARALVMRETRTTIRKIAAALGL
jgi:hypothetical protein